MLLNLLLVFYQVVVPVIGIALLGYLFGGKLKINSTSLNRIAYYFFVPAFVFHTFSKQSISQEITELLPAILIIQLAIIIFTLGVTRLLKRDRTTTSAYIISSVFPNIGNFALPLLIFRFGDDIIFTATLLFLIILIHSFIISVYFADRSAGLLKGVFSVMKTPAIISFFIALLFSQTSVHLPLPLERITKLMADAMIPVMLFTVGAVLAEIKGFSFDFDVWMMSVLRLLICPLIAWAILEYFDLSLEVKKTALIDFAMPTAILASIIATEYKIIPEKVTMVVLVTTIGSVLTLSVLLTII